MPGLLDTFKQKATAVKDYLYPPAPNGMSLWEYAQLRANDPLQPNLSSRITQQDLINKGLNLAGLAPVGMVGRAKTQYEIAHDIASKNAEKMLGLPKGNTYIDRAKALGMDTPTYHGQKPVQTYSYYEGLGSIADDVTVNEIKSLTPKAGGSEGGALWTSPDVYLANKYANAQGGVVYPLMTRSSDLTVTGMAKPNATYEEINRFNRSIDKTKTKYFNDAIKNNKGVLIKNVEDSPGSSMSEYATDVIGLNGALTRSRFAAFDPAKLASTDLLAGLAPYLGVGGLLGLGMYGNQDRMTD